MWLHSEWFERLDSLVHKGNAVGPRGMGTLELLNQGFTASPGMGLLDVPERNLNYRFAVAEWVWMLAGDADVASIGAYNKQMHQFSDDGIFLTGAYGPHIKAGKSRVLQKLRLDPSTRQAVIQIPRPPVFDTKDEPCTLSLQFLQRDQHLHLIVTMRSSDAWLGVPYDFYTFAQVLNCFAGELRLVRGSLTINAGSAHLYDVNREAAQAILDKRAGTSMFIPSLPGFPPDWLHEVMRTKSIQAIPENFLNEVDVRDPVYSMRRLHQVSPWLPYAAALLAPTSAQARMFLIW